MSHYRVKAEQLIRISHTWRDCGARAQFVADLAWLIATGAFFLDAYLTVCALVFSLPLALWASFCRVRARRAEGLAEWAYFKQFNRESVSKTTWERIKHGKV